MIDEMGLVERDIYEVANQLEGYVGPDTDPDLAAFLLKEGKAAAALADKITAQAAAIERLVAERDEAREALLAVDTWAKAYPLEVFPEPDFNEVKRLLGSTLLSQVSASNMRHVLIGIHGLVSKALGDT